MVEKDNSGEIISLDFDNNKINEILYLITDNILNSVSLLEKGCYENIDSNYIFIDDGIYYVPIGIINNIPVLINLGPKIPFKLDILGSVNSDTGNIVKEYGINSSIVETFINIDIEVQVILPFKSETFSVEKKILLDSKIIQGKIPNYYGGMISTSLK